MNIINLQTGEPFDAAPRMHHREPALEGASSVSSRSRNLLGLRGIMLAKSSNGEEEMYKEMWIGFFGRNYDGEFLIPDVDVTTKYGFYGWPATMPAVVRYPDATVIDSYTIYNGAVKKLYCPSAVTSKIYALKDNNGVAYLEEFYAENLTNLSSQFCSSQRNLVICNVGKVTSVGEYALTGTSANLVVTVKNTMDELMSISGLPWGAATTAKFICSDGHISCDSGTWTKHPN